MSKPQDNLLKWADELAHHKTPVWSTLPDIDLYMDQVITYLERQMSIYSQTDEEKLITPAMINNYVKSGVIPRPVQKKYAREHLAHLITVLSLKQVLSLSDISSLIALKTEDRTIEELFLEFNGMQDEALKHTSERLKESLEKLDGEQSDEEAGKRLSLLALKLSLEANASRIAAKRILDEIMAYTAQNEERNKDKPKDKDKDKDAEKNRMHEKAK